MKTTLGDASIRDIVGRLAAANAEHDTWFVGDPEKRQPVHTVYGGAHLFRADLVAKLGATARKALDEHAPELASFGRAFGLRGSAELPTDPVIVEGLRAALAFDESAVREREPAAWLAHTIRERVAKKLTDEPVEDLRIDFEDGFGARGDAEEDVVAIRAATELAHAMKAESLPPFIGIRIKALSEETRTRAMRTLDLFLTTLLELSAGRLPPGFVVTLPKVTIPEQVGALVDLFERLETGLGLATGALELELMIETTQAIVDAQGRFNLPILLRAARGRCVAAHFGTYDYTASCNITASHQTMTHPSASFARHMMQVAYSRTGIFLSDGATNVLPVPIHRAAGPGGRGLTSREMEENRRGIHAAWKLQFDQVQDSLRRGFYQGWDLHPAQLVARYAATHAFFLEGLEQAAARLSNFIERAAQASRVGDTFDDAATGQGLLNYFSRALNCGALPPREILTRTGLTLDELKTRSFAKIIDGRRSPSPQS